jgi:hypothetical protein
MDQSWCLINDVEMTLSVEGEPRQPWEHLTAECLRSDGFPRERVKSFRAPCQVHHDKKTKPTQERL